MANGRDLMTDKISRSEAEWKAQLTPEQYRIARQQGTERAFAGEYWDNHREGVYRCVGCGEPVFDSKDKFESGTGWPSYMRPAAPGAIEEQVDSSHGMRRVEVHCAKCSSHMGHLFEDGPAETGLRYCINSGSLKFEEKK